MEYPNDKKEDIEKQYGLPLEEDDHYLYRKVGKQLGLPREMEDLR